MRKTFAYLAVVIALTLLSGAALSGDSMFLNDCAVSGAAADNGPVKSEALDFCEAPPPVPVCAPTPPVCAPTPPACPAPAVKLVQVPVKTVVNECKTVTVKKKVYEEECYVAEEKQTVVVDEVRTRTATRNVEVYVPKTVSEAKIVTVRDPGYGTVPRLARGVSRKVVPVKKYKPEQYEETYVQQVRHTVSVPTVKSRKVAREIEEVQTVNVPRTVTTMETRVATR